jgi:hypothetical protein
MAAQSVDFCAGKCYSVDGGLACREPEKISQIGKAGKIEK